MNLSRSEAAKKRWQNPEYRRKQEASKGWSQEARKRQSEKKKEDWADPEYREKVLASSGTRYTEEVRKKISDSATERWKDETYREHMASLKRGRRFNGEPSKGSFVHSDGYVVRTGVVSHPLAVAGWAYEHRMVLFDKIGDGSHQCYWCSREVIWGSSDRQAALCVDHLNSDRQDNSPENLVPSCFKCNWDRGKK